MNVVLFRMQRIMNHIDIGKKEGATLHLGGERHGTEGYFIQPTIFTDVKPEMTIVREEIFGPGEPTFPSLVLCLLPSVFRDNANSPEIHIFSCGGSQVP